MFLMAFCTALSEWVVIFTAFSETWFLIPALPAGRFGRFKTTTLFPSAFSLAKTRVVSSEPSFVIRIWCVSGMVNSRKSGWGKNFRPISLRTTPWKVPVFTIPFSVVLIGGIVMPGLFFFLLRSHNSQSRPVYAIQSIHLDWFLTSPGIVVSVLRKSPHALWNQFIQTSSL